MNTPLEFWSSVARFPSRRWSASACLCARRKGLLWVTVLAAVLGTKGVAVAQDPAPTYTWSGNGGDNLYSNGGNWVNGSTPGYGNLNFGNSTTNTTVNVDTAGLNQHAIFFVSPSNYTLNGNGFTFYDYSGYPSRIENDGTGFGTVNVPLTFASGTSGNTGLNRVEINAIAGDLAFGSAGTVALTGSAVAGIQLFGSGHTVTFNGVISESNGSRYVEINGGNTAVFNAANTYTGNTDVYNGSTLQFAANGSAAGSVLRLGNDDGSGVTAGSGVNTVSLTNATGGQNVTSVLVVAAGTGLLTSTNTSGTNVYSGGVYLDSSLGIRAVAAGGTFSLTGSVDVKNQTLTVSGAGLVNFANGIQSSLSGGAVVYSGTGTLLLNGTGNNAGTTTTINSGTLGGTGTVASPVRVNAATINPGQPGVAGAAAAVGTLSVGALTLDATSTSVFDLASTGSYDQLRSSGAVTLGGNLVVNGAGPFADGTIFDLVGGTSLTGTYAGINNGGFYTFGGQAFQAEYTGTDFELVAVPEPATWFAGILLVATAAIGARRRLRASI